MEEKSLYEILRSENTIIPEIQREYVWGLNEHVLNKFLMDIQEKGNNKINIGFLYSYRPYKNGSDIFLIDGQQRFTTLILLAFYCAIKENKKKHFSELLKLDQPAPAFSYRVRILTEKFVSDLFRNIDTFKTNDIQKEIEDKKWFLDAYKKDTSVKAILHALNTIQKFYDKNAISYESAIHSISFWYFNVGETSQGEELYITMNSRGESLTSSEQIKPLLFEKLESVGKKNAYGKKWDEWEEHFYARKKQMPNFSIYKVDLMMNRFIQTILQIENQTEKTFANNKNEFNPDEIDKINLYILDKYFEALFRIESEIEYFDCLILSCLYGDTQENKHLYPFAFLLKTIFVNPQVETEELIRIYQTIRNAVRRNNGNGIVNYVPMLKFLNGYNGSDFYAYILNSPKESVEKVLDTHELNKINLIKSSSDIKSLENKFWKAQAHEIFSGNISLIITWASSEDIFDVNLFDKYVEIFNKLFHDDCKDIELDITRRALLTRALTEYPRRFRGYTNFSFCWECSDWKTLIFENVEKFGLFLTELFDQEDIYKVQKEMIENFPDEKDYAEFVKIPELLNYCQQKNIQYHDDVGWALIPQKNATKYANLKTYRLYLDLKKFQWEDCIINFCEQNGSCVHFDLQVSKATINIYYKGQDKFYLQLFRAKNQEVQNYFSKVALPLNLKFNGNLYESLPLPKEDIQSLLESITNNS